MRKSELLFIIAFHAIVPARFLDLNTMRPLRFRIRSCRVDPPAVYSFVPRYTEALEPVLLFDLRGNPCGRFFMVVDLLVTEEACESMVSRAVVEDHGTFLNISLQFTAAPPT